MTKRASNALSTILIAYGILIMSFAIGPSNAEVPHYLWWWLIRLLCNITALVGVLCLLLPWVMAPVHEYRAMKRRDAHDN